MPGLQEYKENTDLPGKLFPINVFHNYSSQERVLYLHWHDHLEMIYMVKGQAVFDIGGQSYAAEPGDVLFVHSGELHSGYSISNQNVEFYAIVFSKSLLCSDVGDPLYNSMILPFVEGIKRFPARVAADHAEYEEFAAPVRRIIDEFQGKRIGYELSIRSCLQLLVAAALRESAARQEPGKDNGETDRFRAKQFEKLFAFIREEYARPISLQEAARLTTMSVHHFCKTFKRITGRTFVEFVNLHRINEAEQLLRMTEISVTEAADRVGFGSIHYFIRTFKHFKHYSPSQCRHR